MLFQCKVCSPATDHGSAPLRSGKTKPWRTIDIHCHCVVPEIMKVLEGTALEKHGLGTIKSPTNNPSMTASLMNGTTLVQATATQEK